jgi:serine/threonine protein kinase
MSPKLRPPALDLEARRAYAWPSTSGRRFADIREFELQKPLGKGGFSEVYRGLCKKDGRTYAVKKVAAV